MKWLADENPDNAIVRGLLRRSYGFDIARAQDGVSAASVDEAGLAWPPELRGRTAIITAPAWAANPRKIPDRGGLQAEPQPRASAHHPQDDGQRRGLRDWPV